MSLRSLGYGTTWALLSAALKTAPTPLPSRTDI